MPTRFSPGFGQSCRGGGGGGGARIGKAGQVAQALDYLLVVHWGPAVKSRGERRGFVLTLPVSWTLSVQC